MYRRFYGLSRRPFDLTPAEGDGLYLSESHKEGLSTLKYGVISDKGFLLMTGGVGMGKTSIINTLLGMMKQKVQVCVISNPTLTRVEFYQFLGAKLNFSSVKNKIGFILDFCDLLDKLEKTGEKLLLIIDEAQVFPIQLLEEIRLLSNHAGNRNVLSIFLVGQPEFDDILLHSQLLPLRQRIGLRYHLQPFVRKETEQYIIHKLRTAGVVTSAIFTNRAFDLIHELSHGNPRLINVICDHSMISAFTGNIKQIDHHIVGDALKDITLPGESQLNISEFQKPREEKPVRRLGEKKFSLKRIIGFIFIPLAVLAGFLFFIYDQGWYQRWF
jgi:general secretion pathway protein A